MPSDLFGIPLHEHCETTQYVLEVGVKLWLNYPFSFFFFLDAAATRTPKPHFLPD